MIYSKAVILAAVAALLVSAPALADGKKKGEWKHKYANIAKAKANASTHHNKSQSASARQ